jgi:hypothetical protein
MPLHFSPLHPVARAIEVSSVVETFASLSRIRKVVGAALSSLVPGIRAK